MNLKNERERANTQVKLARLTARYKSLLVETGGDAELREMTAESLKRSMNQLEAEIARFDASRSPAVAGIS